MLEKITHKHMLWIIFISIAMITLITYALTSLSAGQGNLLMPLDDVYIHFQYARQMAIGHPYQYNLVDPPTSGATSLLYPYLLTLGYLIGFQGLWLGLWAMILGAISLVAAQWAVYRLCLTLETPKLFSLLVAITFGLTGTISWHFMSGMETGLVTALTLWTLLLAIEKRLIAFVIVASILAITRPEGGLIAAIASATLFLRLWGDYKPSRFPSYRAYLLILIIPILAIGLQPLINLLITGTTVATGAQAKSILSNVPQDTGLIMGRIWDNISRMWLEFVTGYDALEGRGWYLPAGLGVLGIASIPMLLMKKSYRLIALMLLAWFLILTLAISTLDNAFWHFKRYQVPMMALFFPLSAWVITAIAQRFIKMQRVIYVIASIILIAFASGLFFQFQHYHALNVNYVYQQPYQMANWLRENTPEDTIVAVHDVGLMRYWGERSTLDMVGLTTPNAAAYWRNGPGSVAEFLINQRPDYIASYGRGHGYGLAFLEDTALYENQLAEFNVPDWQPHANVALAADTQGIYRPNWDITGAPIGQNCSYTPYASPSVADFDVTYLNVADITSEAQFNYQWHTDSLTGFATEVRQFGNQTLAYRLINDRESFTVNLNDNLDTDRVLVTQVHTASAGTIDIFANGNLIDTQWIPNSAGNTINISTIIDAEYISETMMIEIIPNFEVGYYQPICHTIRQALTIDHPYGTTIASYQDNIVQLVEFDLDYLIDSPNSIFVDLVWSIPVLQPVGDYRLFVHLYDDRDQPPLAQWDDYFANMPLGNWQNTLLFNRPDDIFLTIEDLPAGTYQLAIGFYNPNDPTDRLIPESDIYEVTPDGRLWLSEVEIE